MAKELDISICTFNDGTFDVIFIDRATGREITLSGEQKISEEDFTFINEIAPACVWTCYTRVTPQ